MGQWTPFSLSVPAEKIVGACRFFEQGGTQSGTIQRLGLFLSNRRVEKLLALLNEGRRADIDMWRVEFDELDIWQCTVFGSVVKEASITIKGLDDY